MMSLLSEALAAGEVIALTAPKTIRQGLKHIDGLKRLQ